MVRRAIGVVRDAVTEAARNDAGQDTDATIEGDWSAAVNIERLLDALIAGKRATQAGVIASPRAGVWRFRPAPLRRSV
jgi:tRNA(Ile)-lysidine synthase